MQYSLADLAKITGAKPRSIQLWADAGVIQPIKGTERGGSGKHRQFSRHEAMIACIIAPFAARKMAIGGLLALSRKMRAYVRGSSHTAKLMGDPVPFELVASGKQKAFLVLRWWPGDEEPMTSLIMDQRDLNGTFLDVFEPPEETRPATVSDVIAIHVVLKPLGSI